MQEKCEPPQSIEVRAKHKGSSKSSILWSHEGKGQHRETRSKANSEGDSPWKLGAMGGRKKHKFVQGNATRRGSLSERLTI